MKPKVKIKGNPVRIDAIPATVQDKDQPSDTGPLNKTRADFRASEFLRLIKQKGYFVTWKKAMICPCRSPETDQPRVNCTACDGNGFVYRDPIEIQAVLTGIDSKQSFFKIPGHWLEGKLNVTVEPQYRLGFFDSIEMKDGLMVFNEWIIKGNRRGIRSTLPANTDRARYPIVRVVKALIHDNDSLIELEDKVHFQINDQGRLIWTSAGNALVAEGQVISLHYEFHPVFLVVSHVNVLRNTVSQFKTATQTVQDLPIQAIAQIEYMLTPRQQNGEAS